MSLRSKLKKWGFDPLNVAENDPMIDVIKQTGGDAFNILGSDKRDYVQEKVYDGFNDVFNNGNNPIEDMGNAIGQLPVLHDRAKRGLVLDAKNYAAEKDANQVGYNPGGVINSVGAMQQGLGERLGSLRANRDESVSARAQPHLNKLAQEAGLRERSVKMEGSLASAQRTNIAMDKELGDQRIQAQALSQQLSDENGVQKLETEFTSFFNELASRRFTSELTGLGEQMNIWLADQGAKLGYDRLEAEARQATMEMYGRFASSLGMALDDGKKNNNTNNNSYNAWDDINDFGFDAGD